MNIILASASPRRAQLLKQVKLDFTVAVSDIDEAQLESETAIDYVQRMARQKALVGQANNPGDCAIIGADTIVCLDQKVLPKPSNKAEACASLMMLSGRTHSVYTALSVLSPRNKLQAISATSVDFRDISPAEAEAYWNSGEPLDKAGGYAIQGCGAGFVSSIKGSYSGVVGLPLYELMQLLAELEIPAPALIEQ
tara:strand:+ start:107 stop:691 length:585 start_codon:yes stop_codon:yes gene_type:complete